MEVLKIIAISICSVCLILNSISILILVTTTKLTKSRFKTLVVFLSLSDAATGAEFLTHVVLNSFNYGQDSILYACLVLKHLIAGTVAFSLYQTLLICLDRLNATFTVKSRFLRILTTTKAVMASFTVIHLYTIIHLGYDLTEGPNICNVFTTAKLSFVLVLDIPVFVIIALITIVYSVIIMRIVQHHNKIFNQNDMTAITIMNNRNTSSVRSMRRNVLTLGAIILITLAANVPRCVTASYILYSGLHVRTSISLKISNHFLLLNPVLDPVIHVLRIREYRDRLKFVCRCYNKANNNTEVITLTQVIHI